MEILSLFTFIVVLYYAFRDLHKTIIVVAPMSILFQPYLCLRYDSPAISLLFTVQTLLVVLYCFKISIISAWKKFPLKNAYYWIILVYLIGTVVSPLPIMSILPMCISILLSYIFVLVYYSQLNNSKDISISIKAFFCAIILLSLYFLFEFVNQSNPIARTLWEIFPIEKEWIYYSEEIRFGGIRCQSLMSICISWGGLCCMALWVMINSSWNKENKIISIFLLICLFLGVFSSGSRSAYVFGLILIIGWIILYKGKYRAILMIFPFLLMFVFFDIVINSIGAIFDESMSGSNFSQRLLQLESTLDVLTNSLIWGYGIKGLEFIRNSKSTDVLGAESVWLQQMIYFGLLGVVQQLILYISCYKFTNKNKSLIFYLLGWVAFSTMSSSPGLHETYFLIVLILLSKTKTILANR